MKRNTKPSGKYDLTGKIFGDLYVIKYSESLDKDNRRIWECKCLKCGEIVYKTSNILNNCINRCEKQLKEYSNKSKYLRTTFYHMKSRCYKENDSKYKWYGARGIKICNEWLNNIDDFINWSLSNGYKRGLEIDRINNDGDYEPNNCRWVNREVQVNNRRNNVVIEYNGKIKNLKQWCCELNLPYKLTYQRIKRDGFSIEEAFNKK